MLKALLKRVFFSEPLLYVFKEKMEAVTPEEKHGLLHKTNLLYAAGSTLPVVGTWGEDEVWPHSPALFWDDENEVSPHDLHVETSLLKISSRTKQKDCFGLVSCRQKQESKYTIH